MERHNGCLEGAFPFRRGEFQIPRQFFLGGVFAYQMNIIVT